MTAPFSSGDRSRDVSPIGLRRVRFVDDGDVGERELSVLPGRRGVHRRSRTADRDRTRSGSGVRGRGTPVRTVVIDTVVALAARRAGVRRRGHLCGGVMRWPASAFGMKTTRAARGWSTRPCIGSSVLRVSSARRSPGRCRSCGAKDTASRKPSRSRTRWPASRNRRDVARLAGGSRFLFTLITQVLAA
jgi:hypothetical protein